jgi:[ribosomal protein S5]-alanine N-acetyltransferase
LLTLNFNPFPILTTEGLVLKQLTKEDVNDLFWLRSNQDVGKYITRQPYQTVDEAIAFLDKIETNIQNNESILWGISSPGENKIIGTICLWNIKKENYRAEVGYELHPDYWRKGIMNEALGAVTGYGFDTLTMHSIEAIVDPDNTASITLLEKNKFVKEAYFKENYYHNGKFKDTAIYTLLNPTQMRF